MLDKVKMALRVTTDAFNSELTSLIKACIADLNLAGITGATVTIDSDDDLIVQAVVAFCKWRFGEPTNPTQMKELYELQKAQLAMATNYTEW